MQTGEGCSQQRVCRGAGPPTGGVGTQAYAGWNPVKARRGCWGCWPGQVSFPAAPLRHPPQLGRTAHVGLGIRSDGGGGRGALAWPPGRAQWLRVPRPCCCPSSAVHIPRDGRRSQRSRGARRREGGDWPRWPGPHLPRVRPETLHATEGPAVWTPRHPQPRRTRPRPALGPGPGQRAGACACPARLPHRACPAGPAQHLATQDALPVTPAESPEQTTWALHREASANLESTFSS